MERVRVAVAGTGFAQRTILPALSEIESVEVVTLSGGRDLNKTRAVAERFNIPQWELAFDQMVAQPGLDLVFIASPHQYHFDMVRSALEHDLHIVCEKPLALTMSDIEYLLNQSQASEKLHLVNHQLRFFPLFLTFRDLIREGAIGRPYFVKITFQTSRLVSPGMTWRWWFEPENGGGMVLAMGSHLVDLVQFWFGQTIQDVNAYMSPVLNSLPDENGVPRQLHAESLFQARLTLEQDAVADIFCTGVSYQSTFLEINIYGADGEIHFQSPDRAVLYRFDGQGKKQQAPLVPDRPDGAENEVSGSLFDVAFAHLARNLVEALAKNSPAVLKDRVTRFTDYYYHFQVLEAMKQSHETRTTVALAPR